MAEGRLEHDWNFVSHVLAEIRNAIGSVVAGLAGQEYEPVTADQINPLREGGQRQETVIKVPAEVGLKAVFASWSKKRPTRS
jgi:hypothetical protein